MRLAQLTLAWGRVPFSLGMLWVREWVLGGALEYRDLAIWEQDHIKYVNNHTQTHLVPELPKISFSLTFLQTRVARICDILVLQ